jgi:hypothetical protein
MTKRHQGHHAPLWLVKSPPWHMKFGITRWNDEPLNPKPFSPVQSARKFSAVCKNKRERRGREWGRSFWRVFWQQMVCWRNGMAGLACGDNLGDHVRAELHDDAANRLAACRHVEEYLGVGHVAACGEQAGGGTRERRTSARKRHFAKK